MCERVGRRGLALFIFLCVIWGVPFLLIKVAVSEVSAPSLVFLRTAVGAMVLMPLAISRGQIREVLKAWRPVIAYTTVEYAVPWLLLSEGETRLSSSLSSLLVAAAPLLGALLAWVTHSGHQLGWRGVAGLVAGLFGVAVLVGFDVSAADLWAAGGLGLCSLGLAAGPAIVARWLCRLPTVGVVGASLTITAMAFGPIGVLQLMGARLTPDVVVSVATLGVVCTALPFLLFFALIGEVGPVRATVVMYFNPVVALGLGVMVLGESLTVATVAGFALILLGSFLAVRGHQG